MGVEGDIAVELSLEAGRVREAQVTSTRRVDASRALLGAPLEAMLRAVPLLYSVCSEAQGVAAHEACEAALGIEVGEDRREARRLRVACEAMDNHALQVALKWPPLFGIDPLVQPLRALRGATGRLRALAAGTAEGPLRQRRALALEIGEQVLSLTGGPLPLDGVGLHRWATGPGLAPGIVAAVSREGLEDLGRCEVSLLPTLSAAWFEAQTDADPGFEWAPRYQGQPAETGALARLRERPLISGLVRAHGNGLLTRFVARLADLQALAQEVLELTQNLRSAPPIPRPLRFSGRGGAVVETSRGQLAHLVRIEEGRVVGWRVVAPTEWNFHPAGALVAGLRGVRAQGVQRLAALVASGLDPCVAFEVRVQGTVDA